MSSAERRIPAPVVVSVDKRSAADPAYRGGDVFETFTRPDGSIALLIADVSSKGVLSVVHTEMLRRVFRAAAEYERSPARLLSNLNCLRFGAPPPFADVIFASALIMTFESGSAECRYASAGHDIAIIARKRSHKHLEATGPVLGIFRGAEFTERIEGCSKDDLLLVATDGFTECRHASDRSLQFGMSGIVRALAHSISQTSQSLSESVACYADVYTGNCYRDDATVAVIAFRPLA